MKRKKYTEEQIAFVLRQAKQGTSVTDITRKLGGCLNRRPIDGIRSSQGWASQNFVGRNNTEEENRKLKQLIADLSPDKRMLQDVIQGKV